MWIKICGIRCIEDAEAVVSAGADAIGLNFYQKSRRCVSESVAREIAAHCQGSVDIVGVFVNETPTQIAHITQEVGLTAVQFHGDETLQDVQQFQESNPATSVIRAFRVGQETQTLQQQVLPYQHLTPALAAVLVDAWSDSDYGGTGQRVADELLHDHPQLVKRLVLAGGLNPDNVAQAVRAVKPWGVDTASGVESAPGVKSRDLVHRFVAVCRESSSPSVGESIRRD